MKKIELLTPVDYDKISDDLYWLSKTMVMRFNVALSYQNKDGDRIYHHKEYTYGSKYNNTDYAFIMKRSFQFYITIDDLDDYNNSVLIGVKDILLFRAKLQEACSFFTDGTFGQKKNNLIIAKSRNPIIISGLASNKYISLNPIIIQYDETSPQQQGIRLSLSDTSYADMSIDKFYGLIYIANSINMYQSAQLMINYLGRPSLGYNLKEYNYSDNKYEEAEPPEGKSTKRTIRNRTSKSYFDSLGDDDD